MANLQNFVFFNNTSTAGDSNVLSLFPNAGSIMIQVEPNSTTTPGTFSLTLLASMDFDTNNFSQISLINMKDLSKTTAITSTGLYLAAFPGATKIKMNATQIDSNLKVFGTVME